MPEPVLSGRGEGPDGRDVTRCQTHLRLENPWQNQVERTRMQVFPYPSVLVRGYLAFWRISRHTGNRLTRGYIPAPGPTNRHSLAF